MDPSQVLDCPGWLMGGLGDRKFPRSREIQISRAATAPQLQLATNPVAVKPCLPA